MDWMMMLTNLFELVIFPLLGIGTVYLILLIKNKCQQLKLKKDDELYVKYISMLENTIVSCVLATSQTYVESLKKEGKFDAEAQKIALTKTYTNVMKILSEEAKVYLSEALGDLEAYVYNKIEAEVKLTK